MTSTEIKNLEGKSYLNRAPRQRNAELNKDPYTLALILLIGLTIGCKIFVRLPFDIWFYVNKMGDLQNIEFLQDFEDDNTPWYM